MKKILLSILCAFFCLFGMAQTEKIYHDQCTVIPDDEPQEPDDIDVTILDNGDGTINITLLNFVIKTAYGDVDPIDFVFEKVPVVAGEDGYDHVNNYKGRFTIPSSKLPGILKLASSSFQNIPYTLNGKRNEDQMFATININISISVFMVLNKDVSVLVDIKPKKVYTEQLIVTVNNNSTEPQSTDVSVTTNDDETINFELKNFYLTIGGESQPVGNIVLDSLSVQKDEDGILYFSYGAPLEIQAGDLEDVDEEDWLGPKLGALPLNLAGKMNNDKLFTTIDINLEALGQIIHVELGTDDFVDTPTPQPEGKVYTEQLVVTVNGNSSEPQPTDVTVYDNGDGTINFELQNFFLTMQGNSIPIGNIRVENLEATVGEDGLTHFNFDGNIVITPGNQEGIDEASWLGPNLGQIPSTLVGKMNDDKLFTTIDINFAALNQIIHVELGTDDFVDTPTPQPEGKVYTEQLVVTVNGNSSEPQPTDVTVYDNGDGTINFELQNFFLTMEGNSIPIGNIRVENLEATVGEDGLTHFSFDGNIVITPGNQEGIDESSWLGPNLGQIPSTLVGKMNDDKLFTTIDINFAALNQIIHVELGTDDFFDTPQPEGKVYTEQLVVTVNGNSSEPQPTDVTVYDNGDGTINFELQNFFLTMEGNSIPIGNIRVENLEATVGEDGLTHFSFDGNIVITPGNQEGIDESSWLGPNLGQIPSTLVGKMNDDKLFTTIDINFAALNQIIHVELGTDDFDAPEPDGKVYTDQYVITFNGETSEPQETDVTVIDNEDGTIKFVLNDFIITLGDNEISVGDISLDNVTVVEGEDGLKHFYQEGTFDIPADKAGSFAYLADMGYLNNIPYKLDGKMNDEKLFATIDINIELLGQLFVQFGTDFIEEIVGDVNGDGKIDVADAQTVLILVADGIYDKKADVNNDNAVDVADVQAVLIMIADQ